MAMLSFMSDDVFPRACTVAVLIRHCQEDSFTGKYFHQYVTRLDGKTGKALFRERFDDATSVSSPFAIDTSGQYLRLCAVSSSAVLYVARHGLLRHHWHVGQL